MVPMVASLEYAKAVKQEASPRCESTRRIYCGRRDRQSFCRRQSASEESCRCGAGQARRQEGRQGESPEAFAPAAQQDSAISRACQMAKRIMPSRDANLIVEEQLDQLLGKVAEVFDGDALTWSGPLLYGVDSVLRRGIVGRRKVDNSRNLVIVLTTLGGMVEVVQRMVETIRHHYDVVNFAITDYAYSAGT